MLVHAHEDLSIFLSLSFRSIAEKVKHMRVKGNRITVTLTHGLGLLVISSLLPAPRPGKDLTYISLLPC